MIKRAQVLYPNGLVTTKEIKSLRGKIIYFLGSFFVLKSIFHKCNLDDSSTFNFRKWVSYLQVGCTKVEKICDLFDEILKAGGFSKLLL